MQKQYTIHTTGIGFYPLTSLLQDFLSAAPVAEGVVHLFLSHTSASLAITENYDPTVKEDILHFLERLAPRGANYAHALEGPDDMPAHLKNLILPTSLSLPLSKGKLLLGTWQSVYLLEHREEAQQRNIIITLLAFPSLNK